MTTKLRERAQQQLAEVVENLDKLVYLEALEGPISANHSGAYTIATAKLKKAEAIKLLAQVEVQGQLRLIQWVIDVIRSHDENFLDKFQDKRAELLRREAGK